MNTLILISLAVGIAFLAVLVLGLLRSHAEILQRLDIREEDGLPERQRLGENGASEDIAVPAEDTRPRRAYDIAGVTLAGDPIKIGVRAYAGNTLLAFLSSGCVVCADFWKEFRSGKRQAPGDARIVAVTKDATEESPSRLRDLAGSLDVVMSSAAWEAYEITIAPYFVYVNGITGKVAGEGAARTWAQLKNMIGDAVADEQVLANPSWWRPRKRFSRAARPETPAERDTRATAALVAAGIPFDDPSLYPGRDRPEHPSNADE
jgi:hypothetical protein